MSQTKSKLSTAEVKALEAILAAPKNKRLKMKKAYAERFNKTVQSASLYVNRRERKATGEQTSTPLTAPKEKRKTAEKLQRSDIASALEGTEVRIPFKRLKIDSGCLIIEF
jgi:hypothetical protein